MKQKIEEIEERRKQSQRTEPDGDYFEPDHPLVDVISAAAAVAQPEIDQSEAQSATYLENPYLQEGYIPKV